MGQVVPRFPAFCSSYIYIYILMVRRLFLTICIEQYEKKECIKQISLPTIEILFSNAKRQCYCIRDIFFSPYSFNAHWFIAYANQRFHKRFLSKESLYNREFNRAKSSWLGVWKSQALFNVYLILFFQIWLLLSIIDFIILLHLWFVTLYYWKKKIISLNKFSNLETRNNENQNYKKETA